MSFFMIHTACRSFFRKGLERMHLGLEEFHSSNSMGALALGGGFSSRELKSSLTQVLAFLQHSLLRPGLSIPKRLGHSHRSPQVGLFSKRLKTHYCFSDQQSSVAVFQTHTLTFHCHPKKTCKGKKTLSGIIVLIFHICYY